MTAKEYCLSHDTIAVCSDFGGIEIRGIEYAIDDYIYFVAEAMTEKPSYHRVKIRTDNKNESFFIPYNNTRIYLRDCMRINI